ncbi:cytochrome P450 304a1, partial [Asbolus verrucosus]
MLKENYTFSYLSLKKLAQRYKTDIMGLYLGPFPTVATFSYDLCKEMLTRDEFVGRCETIATRTRAFGESKEKDTSFSYSGIFFVDGPFWKEQRRFSLRHMRDYGFGRRSDVMENFVADEVRYLIDFLNNEPKKGNEDICKGKGHVLMPDVLYGSLINSILLVLSSTRFDNDLKLRECARAVHQFLSSIDATGGAICMTPWLKYLAPGFFNFTKIKDSNNHLCNFVEQMIEEHIKTFSDDHHRDFIDDFISETKKHGYELDHKQLVLTVLDYMFPSPVAIGNTITFYMSYLMNNPRIQSKVQEELDRVVGRSRLPTLDDRKEPENFPPGPPKLPLWGSYWFMLKENYNFAHLSLESLGKRYKTDILGLFLGDTPTVVTFSYDLCKELLTKEEFIGRNDTIIVRTRSLGDLKGIFFVDGPFWKEQRRFSLRHMRDYGFGRRSEVIENFVTDEVNYLINFLNNEPGSDDLDICRGKGHVLMPDLLYGPLINSILLVLSSSRFDNYRLRECARAGLRFQRSGDATGAAISITPWLRFLAPDFFGYTSAVVDNGYLIDFLKEVIDDHTKTFSDDHHRDFIDVYISERTKEGYDFDYTQLLMTVLDYMFPAPIAIGHTLSFYFVYLMNNPHVQVKIQDEIDRVVGRSRLPNLNDRKLMPYLEASIREASKDEKIWKNPQEFQPERFLDENGNLLKKDYTIGFGAGKRLCAGETFARQNMFLIVSGLLQNFTLKSPTGKRVDMDVVPGVNLSLTENWVLALPR